MTNKSAFKSLTEYKIFTHAIKRNKLETVASYAKDYNCNSMVSTILPGLRDRRFPIDFAMEFGKKDTCDILVKEGMFLNTFCQDPYDKSAPKVNPIIAAYLHDRDDIAAYLMETYPEKVHFTDSFKGDGVRLADFFDSEGAFHLAKVAHHAEITSHNKRAASYLEQADDLRNKAAEAFKKAAQLKKTIPRNAIIQTQKPPIKKFQK